MSKTYLTGIQSTGMPHLGNYLGAIKPAIEFSKNSDGKFFYFIADYHCLTSLRDPALISQGIYEVAATWLALGLDTNKAIFYKQSDVPEIFELTWILNCHIPKGDLNRAHSYKAAMAVNEKNGKKDLDHGVNAGLFSYPVLMAADILLFDTNIVPVGKDQVQHVEIARSIAQRINQQYGELLVEPLESLSEGKYIPGLDGRKMSKSYGNSIPLFVPEKRLKKLINKITTNSTAPDEPKSTEGSLIFDLYQLFANEEQVSSFAKEFKEGISWGHAKAGLFEVINDHLTEFRQKYNYLMENKHLIDQELETGAKKARAIAQITISRLRKNIMGLKT